MSRNSHPERYAAGLDDLGDAKPVNSLRRHLTLLCVVTMIVSFFIWAAVSEVDQHVRATGRVVPAGNARTVQHLEGGIIMKILVSEGDEVKAGDPLFQIANTRVRTTLQEGTMQSLSLMIRRERLLTEADGKEDLHYSDYLKREQPDFVKAESELFALRRQEHMEKINGLETRVEQKRLEVDSLKQRINNMDTEFTVLSRQVEIKKDLLDSGVVSEASYLEVEGSLARLNTSRSNTSMQVPIVEAEMAEVVSEIEESRRQYTLQAKTELNEVEVNLKGMQEKLAALSDEVERSDISSPIDGRVNKLYMNTVGGVSQPGAPMAEITPDREALVVEGTMSTEDRGKVWPELKTVTHISAYDHAMYGGLSGSLSYISPDAFTNAESGEFYKIRVALDTDRFDDERLVRPGMSAQINILTGKITVLNALLKPFTRLRSNALREG